MPPSQFMRAKADSSLDESQICPGASGNAHCTCWGYGAEHGCCWCEARRAGEAPLSERRQDEMIRKSHDVPPCPHDRSTEGMLPPCLFTASGARPS